MWKTRLLILGLVRWLGPVHGYLIRHELSSWNIPGISDLKPGSIYHALKKLASDGLVEVVATESVGDRPARTTYRVTAEGEREFQHMLRERTWNFEAEADNFEVTFGFALVLGPRETTAMLRQRADYLFEKAEAATQTLASTTADFDPDGAERYIPAHSRAMLRRRAELFAVDAAWCEETADRLESGDLELPPDVDAESSAMWREAILDDFRKKSTKDSVRTP
ncbi:PadR family transcriptional regulator [Salininema proteolyticum]|uniref:PadR family transcriptional regulator n=1 Tax=Salininema proteolyticum TaxID=1607685 RepID=A0ABV8U2T5_9ACTN